MSTSTGVMAGEKMKGTHKKREREKGERIQRKEKKLSVFFRN